MTSLSHYERLKSELLTYSTHTVSIASLRVESQRNVVLTVTKYRLLECVKVTSLIKQIIIEGAYVSLDSVSLRVIREGTVMK